MNDDQINKLNSGETSKTVIDLNKSKWEDSEVFVATVAALGNTITAIHEESQKQASDPKGYTITKKSIKELLVDASLHAVDRKSVV